jgi:N-methylhydantoinase A
MMSSGGITTVETARRFPIRLVESGPAGGAILAQILAAENGIDRALAFDMGGTTAKITLIDDMKPQQAAFEIARAARFVKGSGIPVRIPVIDMVEIGAGGGSIARVDGLGASRSGRTALGPCRARPATGAAARCRR